MPEPTPREVLDNYVKAINAGDWELMREVLAPDYIEDYPQSGERVRGRENAIAVRSRYPRPRTSPPEGFASGAELVVGGEERWALAPNFTAIRVTAQGDTLTALVRAVYPDGPWYVVYIATIDAGQIRRATLIFGALFDAPVWRALWTERMPDRER